MIDFLSEQVITLSDVPAHVPPLRAGKPITTQAVYNWTISGVRGIRLERAKLGGVWVTSLEAIQRFMERLTAAAEAPPASAAEKAGRRRSEAARKELAALGI